MNQKSKVESILPLLKNQEILLANHLLSKVDSGIIMVRAEISGHVDVVKFEKALQQLAKEEEVFRMSIQWENLSKKIQVVQSDVDLPFTFYEGEDKTDTELLELIDDIEKQDFSLSKAPISEFHLLQKSKNEYLLIWKCHHILFDGISSRLALEKLALLYENSISVETSNTWKKVVSIINDQTLKNKAKKFWEHELKGLSAPSFLSSAKDETKKELILKIEKDLVDPILSTNGLTINSFFQSLVLILLSRLQKSETAILGTVVSGRNLNGLDVRQFIGMLANVTPLINKVSLSNTFEHFCKEVQKKYAEIREYEHYSIQHLFEQHEWTGNRNLFDCLLVVENFESKKISTSTFEINSVRSSLTTNYPLTITILPKDEIDIHILGNSEVPNLLVDWFFESMKRLIEQVSKSPDLLISDLMLQLQDIDISAAQELKTVDYHQPNTTSSTATNHIELALTKIWEKVLQYHPIDTEDHFFEIGGKSIHAVRMVTLIENELGKKLNPSVLLNHPTIKELSTLLVDGSTTQWQSLVPIKSKGDLAPLFCIHAGGAHVFMYNHLAKYISSDRPVYALQPLGLDGQTNPHQSIEEMAAYYLNEIKQVIGANKIHIVGHCFSGAVALEMGRQLLKDDPQNLGEICIVDSTVFSFFLKENEYQPNIGLRWRFFKKIFTGKFDQVYEILKERYSEFKRLKLSESAVKNLENLVLHMNDIYLNYDWQPIQYPIHLITSSEFANREDKLHHIKGWNAMSNHQMTNQIIEAKHQQIFDTPSVVELANAIELILDPQVQLSFVQEQVNSEVNRT